MMLGMLGDSQYTRFASCDDLDRAISAGETVIAVTSPEHPDRVGLLFDLSERNVKQGSIDSGRLKTLRTRFGIVKLHLLQSAKRA